MSSSNPTRFLADDRSLALKVFWGKAIEAFRDHTLLWNVGADVPGDEPGPSVIAQKSLEGQGGSAKFPLIGDDPTAEDHTPGTELLGQTIAFDEGEIAVDDICAAHNDVPLDQAKISHYDVFAPIAMKLGRSVALKLDKRAIHIGLNAARTAAKSGFHSGGNVVSRVGAAALTDAYPISSTGAQNFRKDAAELAKLMDDDNVPEEDRYLYIIPLIRQVLGQDSTIFDQRFNPGTMNNINKRVIGELEGFKVMVAKGSRMPSTNVTTGKTKYQGDFSRTGSTGQPVALALCGATEGEAAVGCVTAGGLYSHMHFDERRNTTFMKSQALVGFDKLSVWCAGEIRVPSA